MKLILLINFCALLLFFKSCRIHQEKTRDIDLVLKCIQNYKHEISSFQEFKIVRNEFYCFFDNANIALRKNYIEPVELIELDSLMIFNENRDSVLLFYFHDGSKFRNGKLFYINYIFAHKNNSGRWTFYDRSCPTSIYSISKYTKSDVIKNTYLQLSINEEWLKNEIVCDFDANYTAIACNNYCGPCGLERELKINPDAMKFYEPIPDSLFGCN